jgi:hypothetical protein
MQLLINADDNLDDVLVVLGRLFGRELQDVGPRGLSTDAPSGTRSSAASAGPAGKRTPATKGRSATPRGAARGESAAKRTGASRGKKGATSSSTAGASSPLDTSPVRAWARANGHAVNARGRLPASVIKAYIAAQR